MYALEYIDVFETRKLKILMYYRVLSNYFADKITVLPSVVFFGKILIVVDESSK